jgi:hypothetical protein
MDEGTRTRVGSRYSPIRGWYVNIHRDLSACEPCISDLALKAPLSTRGPPEVGSGGARCGLEVGGCYECS